MKDRDLRVPRESDDLVRMKSGEFVRLALRGEEGGDDEKCPEDQGRPPGIT
jgi:hypothetical protein